MKKHSLRLVRSFFIILLVFEFLNWIGVFHIQVEFSWAGLIITAGAVYAFLEFLEHRLKKYHGANLPPIAFLLGLIPVLYDAAGDIFHFYGRFNGYDKVGHFFGAGMAAAVIFIFLKTLSEAGYINWNLRTKAFFSFTAAVTFGVLYELEEFGEDLLTCFHKDFIPFLVKMLLPCGHRFGDAYDTGGDLFFDVLGALAAVIIGWSIVRIMRKKEDE